MIFTILFVLLGINLVFSEDMCTYSDNAINPEVSVTVERQKDGSFLYNYKISNEKNSKLPIWWFFVETNGQHKDVSQPQDWKILSWDKKDTQLLKWSTKEYKKGDVEINGEKSGFKFSSDSKPGLVRYRSQGAYYLPAIEQNVTFSSVKGLCPGSYQAGSTIPGFASIEGITLGPVADNRKSAELRIKKPASKTWTGFYKSSDEELLAFSPIEKGQVELALLDNEELAPEDIDLESVRFGRGEAKPIKASISDCELSPAKKTKALLMTFDIYSLNVLCNTDHALFLTAKTKTGLDVFGGVKIRATECSQENWEREAKKMIDSGLLELPAGKYKKK